MWISFNLFFNEETVILRIEAAVHRSLGVASAPQKDDKGVQVKACQAYWALDLLNLVGRHSVLLDKEMETAIAYKRASVIS